MTADRVDTPDPATAAVPLYWYRPLRTLPATAGMHRVTWDFRYQPLPGSGGRGAGRGGGSRPDTVSSIGGTLTPLMSLLQGADAAPTSQLLAAVTGRRAALAKLLAR